MLIQPINIIRIIVFILLIVSPGCNHPADVKKPIKEKPGTVKKTNELTAVDTIFAGERDTSVIINGNEAFIKGRIVANQAQPKYTLSLKKGQRVTAVLKAFRKGGNVRINQIQQPGGAFDGPFGDSLNYILKKSGNLRFLIGENLMAGDPYTGEFILHIKVSE